jgi:uncharacterized protein (TIGR01777 family)
MQTDMQHTKIVLAGGSGHIGRILARHLQQRGHDVVVLTRAASTAPGIVHWDGRHPGPWVQAIDGADAIVNLAGRSVNCRYTKHNLQEMLGSRVDSTRAIGRAIQAAARPPRVWLQMSTATIYAHRFDAPNDEATGLIGGDEPDAPVYWRTSIDIAQAWERTLAEADTPATRKVALRSAMVMSPEPGGVFEVLHGLTRLGLGGTIAGGRQFVSWIHAWDFARAVAFLLDREEIAGPVNLAAPNPLPQRDFMAALRSACGVPIGVPATAGMLEVAAFIHRTDTELLLKSRRVIPGRLLEHGFPFEYPDWPDAARDLVRRAQGRSHKGAAA